MREPLPSPDVIAKLPNDGGDTFNRLVFERSPYLRRHARNPIKWYAWGKEALELARAEDKPIFLSIGYATCHWCDVMERESFESPMVAKLLNGRYIPIKVDREERPDLDRLYMPATEVLTGHVGWPNSLWLTPDGQPFYAGAYFPTQDDQAGGTKRIGLVTLLDRLASFWETRRDAAAEQAQRVVEAMAQHRQTTMAGSGKPAPELLDIWFENILAAQDHANGGFRTTGPKFPPHTTLRLLLAEAKNEFATELADYEAMLEESGQEPDEENPFQPSGGEAWKALTKALDAMAQGGIYDHVGGGFHRYSTDAAWLVPRFEKLLSDNAQLAAIYADAYRLGNLPRHARVARSVAQWMIRELRDVDEGFQSAVEADAEGENGIYYAWEKQEIMASLGPTDGPLYCEIYGVKDEGNWLDPATGLRRATNILHLQRSLEDEATMRGEDPARFVPRILGLNKRMHETRSNRLPPTRDTKVLSAWNGLAVSALAKVGSALEVEGFIESARLAGSFVTRKLIEADKFYAVFTSGEAYTNATLDDYAFVAQAMLDLHEATRAKRWLESARRLADWMIERFYSDDDGFYFTSHEHEELLVRFADPLDGSTPSGNGVASSVLLRLGRIDRNKKYIRVAESTLNHFGDLMRQRPRVTESMLEALGHLRELEKARSESEQETFPRGDIQLALEPIQLSAYISTRATSPGQRIYVAVRIVIASQFHLPAFEGAGEASTPTKLVLTDESSFKVDTLEASPPEKRMVGGEALMLHSDDLWICATIDATAGIPEDRYKLAFELQFRARDDEHSLEKQTLAFSLPIALEDGAPKGINRHKEIFDRFFWEYRQR